MVWLTIIETESLFGFQIPFNIFLTAVLAQAVDVGSLKGVSAPSLRILVWVLSFLSFGYATSEFEVTEERLGVYRPEEHIDNPKDYADNKDARQYDQRLRGPVQEVELAIDNNTGMKNYIANESGGWATSSGYVKFSFTRSIHFGRLYTSGIGDNKGRELDLCEALRCLGQGLHCLEDFGAHSNYVELALIELGYKDVFPHTGSATKMRIRGRHIYPLVTGTFGAVDFLHSVLGEATDHFSQAEVDEMDIVLKNAESGQSGNQRRHSLMSCGGDFISLLSKIPGSGAKLSSAARNLHSASQTQRHENFMRSESQFRAYAQDTSEPRIGVPNIKSDFDPVETARKIYPILEFRDKVVKAIDKTIAKIPGLESLVEKISETLTLFILSLISPYVRPIIDSASKTLKQGSSAVIEASAKAQFEPWDNPVCTDPTHSMLAKDHFSNVLNSVAGQVATVILQYASPRILYAWENPGINVDEVMNDIRRAFHHPALRDESHELHQNMFNVVRNWAESHPDRHKLNEILGSESVRAGRNHILNESTKEVGCNHGSWGGHGKTAGSIWSEIKNRDLEAMRGNDRRYRDSYMNPIPPRIVRNPCLPKFDHR
ncbi:putative heterokaryon incompatibility protein het-c protein [Erysiphe necator]|uniref:Putative heterokaryon incompatibility protein het-c protein n=1 Tax=Uncinula necator TaxID=52586 RepID=A0A0B1P3R4_UNCNE|nr:putative heterokaryon incompatibility protein het-c protein [Erysiphe necator]